MLDWNQMSRLDAKFPGAFTSPMGRKLQIDRSGEYPKITDRIQELFGSTRHPTVGPRQTPMKVVLTSPAHRPMQVTMDIPNFWKTYCADARKDMRDKIATRNGF